MNPSDRHEVLEELNLSRSLLLEVTASLTESQSVYKPAAGCWSVAEIVEHVAVAEELRFRLLTTAQAVIPAPAGEERHRILRERALDRTHGYSSPEAILPGGRFRSLPEGLESFRQIRDRTIAYVCQCRDDLRLRSTAHPLAGVISAHECLWLLALYPRRHADQIRQLRESVGFPEE
jgi:hypothetical protein